MNKQNEHAIAINDLTFKWPNQSSYQLDIPNWTIKTGQKVFLYGRSGEGKSSLLNLISGIEGRYQGNINVLGQDLKALSASQRDKFRATNIGVIFQQFNLLPYLTGKENVMLAGYFNPSSHDENNHWWQVICSKLELSEALMNKKAYLLSVGQQQRIALARALYCQPRLIIADEPTSALDSETRDNFIQLLISASENSTVLFVSHDRDLATNFDQNISLASIQTLQEQANVD